jgi:hypothetical protein
MKERTFKAAVFTTEGELKTISLPRDGWLDVAKKKAGIDYAAFLFATIDGVKFRFMYDEDTQCFHDSQPTFLSDEGNVLLKGNLIIFHPAQNRNTVYKIPNITQSDLKVIKNSLGIFVSVNWGISGAIMGGKYVE